MFSFPAGTVLTRCPLTMGPSLPTSIYLAQHPVHGYTVAYRTRLQRRGRYAPVEPSNDFQLTYHNRVDGLVNALRGNETDWWPTLLALVQDMDRAMLPCEAIALALELLCRDNPDAAHAEAVLFGLTNPALAAEVTALRAGLAPHGNPND